MPTPDAALDDLAFHVALRLMGPDERRRLRIALARDPALEGGPQFDVEHAERLSRLADGSLPAVTLQDRADLARLRRERHAPVFDAGFWARREAELIRAGFADEQAAALIADVRGRLEPTEERVACSA